MNRTQTYIFSICIKYNEHNKAIIKFINDSYQRCELGVDKHGILRKFFNIPIVSWYRLLADEYVWTTLYTCMINLSVCSYVVLYVIWKNSFLKISAQLSSLWLFQNFLTCNCQRCIHMLHHSRLYTIQCSLLRFWVERFIGRISQFMDLKVLQFRNSGTNICRFGYC